jgi:hypothetical protein
MFRRRRSRPCRATAGEPARCNVPFGRRHRAIAWRYAVADRAGRGSARRSARRAFHRKNRGMGGLVADSRRIRFAARIRASFRRPSCRHPSPAPSQSFCRPGPSVPRQLPTRLRKRLPHSGGSVASNIRSWDAPYARARWPSTIGQPRFLCCNRAMRPRPAGPSSRSNRRPGPRTPGR